MSVDTVNHSTRKHAKLSASSSARWLTCTASVSLTDHLPNPSSKFAQEGTAAHEVADMCLQNNCNADKYLGDIVEDFVVDEDMVYYVQQYLDYVRDLGGTMFPEQRVDFSNYIPEGFGTSDAIVIDEPNKHVHILDLKYGKGIEVSAEDNTQGMLYAVGVMNEYGFIYDIEKVTIHIVQPRIGNFSEWSISVKDLHIWATWASSRADEALSGEGVFRPSPKACQWCLANSTCRERAKYFENIIKMEFDDLDGEPKKDLKELTDDEVSNILAHKEDIVKWLKAVEGHVISKLENGEPMKGWKMVAGRSIRKWSPDAETELETLLGDDAYSKKLIGVTDAEKRLGKKAFADLDLTIKPDGKPTLVPESDKRQAIENIKDMF